MNQTVYLIEDYRVKNFFPLAYSRPVFELRTGTMSLRERFKLFWGASNPPGYICRAEVTETFRQSTRETSINYIDKGDALFVNGRLLTTPDVVTSLRQLPPNTRLRDQHGNVVAVRLVMAEANELNNASPLFDKEGLDDREVSATLFNYPWEFIHKNAELLEADARYLYHLGQVEGTVHIGAHIVDRNNVYIGKNAVVKPGAVLDAETGPIIIDEAAEIMASATIQGPAYIGKKTKVKMGAKIYAGTTIGEMCKAGGEIEGSIIHAYSNKQHEGFLGHSYIGMWCNIGADTNNSDLKNNYRPVDVVLNGKKVETGLLFVGLIMGDHSKSGINTMFNTGATVGFSCNVFGAGYLPKYIPSFTWHDNAISPSEYRLEKAIEVAKRVMERRNVTFTDSDERLFKSIFQLTQVERNYGQAAGVKLL